jgi:hypothetical protein
MRGRISVSSASLISAARAGSSSEMSPVTRSAHAVLAPHGRKAALRASTLTISASGT